MRATMAVIVLMASPALGQDADKGPERRRQVFETWGDEWFRIEGKEDTPPVYHHISSRRCRGCEGNDWLVTFERFLPLSWNIAIDRTTLHLEDVPSLTLLKAVEATVDDPWRDSVRLTFGEKSVRSEVEVCIGSHEDLRRDFKQEHSWELKYDARPGHPRGLWKQVEFMSLEGTERISLPMLCGRQVRNMSLKFVETSELEYDGSPIKTRCYQAEVEGEKGVLRFWVSPEHGLLKAEAGEGGCNRRVSAEAAVRELADLEQKAEKRRREVLEDKEDPEPDPLRRDVRVVMVCGDGGEDVKTTVNGREASDASNLAALLVEASEACKKEGKSCVVVIEAGLKVPWKQVIEVMDACKQNGIEKVELAPPVPLKK